MLEKRLRKIQFGFTTGKGTVDVIYTVRRLQERRSSLCVSGPEISNWMGSQEKKIFQKDWCGRWSLYVMQIWEGYSKELTFVLVCIKDPPFYYSYLPLSLMCNQNLDRKILFLNFLNYCMPMTLCLLRKQCNKCKSILGNHLLKVKYWRFRFLTWTCIRCKTCEKWIRVSSTRIKRV